MSGFGAIFGGKPKLDPPNTNIPASKPVEPVLPSAALIAEAKRWVGTKEVGKNGGKQVNAFQASVGLSTGDPWCMAFVVFCVKATGIKPRMKVTSGHCLTVWNDSPKELRCGAEPGAVIIWRHGTSSSGHTGIVVSVASDGTLTTIEGNTGPEDHVNSNGDGVYLKHRSPKGSGDMRVVGFLRPF